MGEHDFTSFAAVDPERGREEEVSNVRQIFCSSWERQADEFVYTVRGNGFLHHMVRNLVGTFLLAGKGTLKASDLTADSGSPLPLRRRSHSPGQRLVPGERRVLSAFVWSRATRPRLLNCCFPYGNRSQNRRSQNRLNQSRNRRSVCANSNAHPKRKSMPRLRERKFSASLMG